MRSVHIRNLTYYSVLGILLGLLFFLDLYLGSVRISFSDLISFISFQGIDDPTTFNILANIRLPKAISGILAGSALAVSGLQMQTIFRNPLAGPYVLGISAGAGLGVAVAVLSFTSLALPLWLSQMSLALSAMIGAMLVLLLVLIVSLRVKDIMTILILGMMFGSSASAIVSILQYFSSESSLHSFVIWTMGSLGNVTGIQLRLFIALVLGGLVLAQILSKPLNVILLGDNYAKNLGVNVNRIRFLVFVSTSILAGVTTAYCGPIGFIGIAIPHIVKIILRTSNHFLLIPTTVLMGASVMLFCDIISQVPGYDIVLPLNAVAAIMGIPVVIYVVLKNKRVAAR